MRETCNIGRRLLLVMSSTEYARPPSFEAVYETLFPIIFRVSLRVTGDREIAEDLCHEAFIKLMERPNLLPGSGSMQVLVDTGRQEPLSQL